MYEGAVSLGLVMNVIDPARRAEDFGDLMREKIMDVRVRLARKMISYFATAEVAGSFVPLSDLIVAPGILGSMVFVLFHILGYKIEKLQAAKVAFELIKACLGVLIVDFGASLAIGATVAASFILGPLAGVAVAGSLSAQAYFKYRRAVILGEVTLEYIKNDCSWGGEEPAVVNRLVASKVATVPDQPATINPNHNPSVERNQPMQNATTNYNGNGHTPIAATSSMSAPEEKSSLEQALDQVESVKGSLRGAVTNLNGLADTLRQVQRERRLSEREVRSVRDTLKSLQTVRL